MSCKNPLENEDIDYSYSVTKNEFTITGYDGNDAKITIPPTLGSNVFDNNTESFKFMYPLQVFKII
ncbi:MAG: hypothetical protein WC162_03405 [Sphaerochaetaceae bacterium]